MRGSLNLGGAVIEERELLERLMAGPVSGDALARASGLSRAAVWKRIQALRDAGVPIQAQAGRGYRLEQPMDLLSPAAILGALDPATAASVHGLEVEWSLDSTNSALLRRAPPVAPGRVEVLMAERQTGGRGRRGRHWASPLAAHLYLSLARGFEGGLARLGGLSLVAGIAVAEALHAFGVDAARLKWPNDIVVEAADGLRKLGGVLVEGGGEHAGPVRAVIGIGLNVRMPPAEAAAIDQPWCDLEALAGPGVDRNRVAATLLSHLLPALDAFDAEGLAPFMARHAALDVLAGRAVRLHGEGVAVRTGTALGLAADGALRVRLDSGECCDVHSGEVSVRRLESPA
ncbi:bifunctional biotin--[acetyl-CoA-carboxylase] ligase/biotin operon repressor BirA [Lysobacter aestuarii]|uniref:Bifunctional ligase/repressor BirA n=1 Tax=Marilutibacter aestuarii TaxID=1706195 RepID=A0A507ZP21_9GAMM|nr:bifunctional biotin--[acetyl-CoA-carboxylase] ligase/biotin operon repressor BirA [Lysobacter aestuarii]